MSDSDIYVYVPHIKFMSCLLCWHVLLICDISTYIFEALKLKIKKKDDAQFHDNQSYK